MIPALQWWTQHNTFSSDMKVLPLKSYDLILGVDWLEMVGDMWANWKKKTMRFRHQGKRITLRGVTDDTTTCSIIASKQLKGLLRKGAIAHMIELNHMEDTSVTPVGTVPDEVQALITANQNLFQEPANLLPHRTFDHSILSCQDQNQSTSSRTDIIPCQRQRLKPRLP